MYIWSVNNNLVLASSLGYFSAPLLYFVFSYFIFKESLNLYKITSILLGFLAFIILATSADYTALLVATSLAFSFVTYGAIHKKYQMPSIESIYFEALIMSPLALAYLYYQNGFYIFSSQPSLYLIILLVLSGIVTVVPLLCFSTAVKNLPLFSVGILQYITPIMTFLLGVYVFNEPLEPIKLYSFVIIWLAILISIIGMIKNYRKVYKA
jgi:chloramphenicol-sensitive protein RarD